MTNILDQAYRELREWHVILEVLERYNGSEFTAANKNSEGKLYTAHNKQKQNWLSIKKRLILLIVILPFVTLGIIFGEELSDSA